jgi:hypothetical protein
MWGRPRSWQPGRWPERTTRPRVLLEDPDGAILATGELFLQRQGFDVAACLGPQRMGHRRCQLTTGGRCQLAQDADVVYSSLSWSDPNSREVLVALRAEYPRTPVVVEILARDVEGLRADLDGCHLAASPTRRATMVTAIRSALLSPASSDSDRATA